MNIPLSLLYDKVKYSIQYVDGSGWTVPAKLTAKRAESALTDFSISKIRLYRAKTTVLCTLDMRNAQAKEDFKQNPFYQEVPGAENAI